MSVSGLYADWDDERLVLAMAQRDENALVEMHRRYARLLYGLGHKMLRQQNDVETCVQDAFMNMWNHAAHFDPARAKAKTWLVSIAHHRFLQERRDRPGPALELADWDAPVRDKDPLSVLLTARAIAHLEPHQRQLVELAFFQGHTHAEIARLTGLPLGTVKSRLRAILDQMRRTLGGQEAESKMRSPEGEP